MQANMGAANIDVLSMIQDSVLTMPTLPVVFVAVLEQITAKNAAAEDVARIIEKDQSLTARVLAVANSAYYGFQQLPEYPDGKRARKGRITSAFS